MSDLIFAGGTVVTTEASFRADVAVSGETIEAVGLDLPRDGAEVVDVSGARLMPGFIDGHTHMDMPFGGTVTADNWDTGTAAAVAGGTIKIFMAYKGTPLYTEDDDLFEAMQIARDCGLLVLVHAENGDAIAKLQEQALARGDVEPKWHGLTRPEAVEAEATNRAIRLAEIAGAPLLVVHVSCAAALEEVRRAHARGRPVYAETCPQYLVFSDADLARPGFEGAKYVLSPPLRDPSNRPALWHGLQAGDLQIFGSDHCSFNYAGQKELGADDFTLIPNGLPGVEERPYVLWTHGVREGKITENLFVAALSTNQARVHGMAGRKGMLAPGADADIVVWDPDMTVTATQSNRHNNVDYTPYEGMTFTGGPASVYIRGKLAFEDGEVLAEPGSGRFVHRTFAQPAPGPAVR